MRLIIYERTKNYTMFVILYKSISNYILFCYEVCFAGKTKKSIILTFVLTTIEITQAKKHCSNRSSTSKICIPPHICQKAIPVIK